MKALGLGIFCIDREADDAVFAMLEAKGARGTGTLFQILMATTHQRSTTIPVISASAVGDFPRRSRITLPPRARWKATWDTSDFAEAALAHSMRTNTRSLKLRLAEARHEAAIVYHWQEYQKWLAATPEALREFSTYIPVAESS